VSVSLIYNLSFLYPIVDGTLPKATLASVASLLARTLFQGNPDRNHKLWNIGSI
jgi:hypothetical protein